MSYFDIQKGVVVKVIVLSKRSRAFIITQAALPGFLLRRYETLSSLVFNELKISVKSQSEFDAGHSLEEIEVVRKDLVAENSTDAIANFKHASPSHYVAYLTLEGKTDDLKALCDGKPQAWNLFWYVQIFVLPRLKRMRSEGQLVPD